MKKNNKRKFYGPLIGICILFAIWWFVCASGIVNSYVLPSPARVGTAFLKMIASGEIFRDVGISLMRVLKGFLIAALLAFVLGAFRLAFPKLSPFYEYLVHFFRNVPPLAMIPLLILWFGIGETTKTVIIVLATFFPIYLSIVKGFTSVDQKLLEVGRMFKFSAARTFWKIVLPSAMPDILVGMRTGLGYAWRSIIAAEMIAASTGLGHMILFAQQTSRTDKVIVGIFVIGLIGYLTDFLFGKLIQKTLGGVAGNGWN